MEAPITPEEVIERKSLELPAIIIEFINELIMSRLQTKILELESPIEITLNIKNVEVGMAIYTGLRMETIRKSEYIQKIPMLYSRYGWNVETTNDGECIRFRGFPVNLY